MNQILNRAAAEMLSCLVTSRLLLQEKKSASRRRDLSIPDQAIQPALLWRKIWRLSKTANTALLFPLDWQRFPTFFFSSRKTTMWYQSMMFMEEPEGSSVRFLHSLE